MGKIDGNLHEVVVVLENGEQVKYLTTHYPKKSTAGNSIFGTLNYIGFAELQAQGHKVYDEKDYCELIRRTFGLSENAVGSRGASWKTEEDRAKVKVYLDGQEFNPEFTKKQKEAALAQAQLKEKVEESVGVAVQPQAPIMQQETQIAAAVPQIPQPPQAPPMPSVPMTNVTPVLGAMPQPQVPQVQIPQAPTIQAPVPQIETPKINQENVQIGKVAIQSGQYTKEQVKDLLFKDIKDKEVAKATWAEIEKQTISFK
ncbi:hypothetical protein [Oceanihabitans sediminis]|uniref:hypothetical protein n=1 Tax=Oceanihabitans sediminis TaxID=1812012 RepID=UPI00299DCB37|nr:hypothetical protein [Oceanihabitans sediminis]MDX1279363.1 hypothetical protein [Oceanihabitans sediminis]